jgi:hypothetical protein
MWLQITESGFVDKDIFELFRRLFSSRKPAERWCDCSAHLAVLADDRLLLPNRLSCRLGTYGEVRDRPVYGTIYGEV